MNDHNMWSPGNLILGAILFFALIALLVLADAIGHWVGGAVITNLHII